MALGDKRAVELLNSNPLGREHRALIGSAVGEDRRAFLVQPYRHASRAWILYHSLERKETAAADNRRLDLLIALPATHATMRVKNFSKQFVHQSVSLAF